MIRTRDFKDLILWQKAKAVAVDLYRITNSFPVEEKYGIVSQIRRAGISIAANVAEGAGRSSAKGFCRFLDIAIGSAFEIQTLLSISNDLLFIKDQKFMEIEMQLEEIIKITIGLKRHLLRSP